MKLEVAVNERDLEELRFDWLGNQSEGRCFSSRSRP
jgi:hypothetical protein